MPTRGGHPVGRRDRAQLGGDHQQPEVELGEGLGDALVDPARQVDDDRAAAPAGGGEHRPHGLRRDGDASRRGPS